jgi:hypothetical protein
MARHSVATWFLRCVFAWQRAIASRAACRLTTAALAGQNNQWPGQQMKTNEKTQRTLHPNTLPLVSLSHRANCIGASRWEPGRGINKIAVDAAN